MTMTTIDSAGRIVVPKALRDAMGLTAGQLIDLSFVDGRIEIELAPTEVTVTHHRGFPIVTAREPLPPLTDDEVRATVDSVRR